MQFAAAAENVLAISGLRASQEFPAIRVVVSESHVAHAPYEVPLW
jgi:hypothetical protein